MPQTALNRLEDDDEGHSELDHGDDGGDGDGGKGGSGKGASSSSVRKAQNRVAQREFRQRKQQYIRDLEARVEVLSGDKEERVELVMLLVRNLLKENKDLRGMIQQMAGFLGEGLGSCLPRLGLSAAQLDALLNRADTDTAYEAFVKLRASREQEEANPGIPFGEIKRKPGQTKRKRDSHTEGLVSSGLGPDSAHTGSAGQTPDYQSAPPDKVARPDEGQVRSIDNYADTYSYLFPDSAGAGTGAPTDWRYQPSNPSGPAPTYPASPIMQFRELGPGQQQQQQQQQPYNFQNPQGPRGMFPLGGPMFQPQGNMWGPFGAMTGDLSGFGLTLPPGQNIPQVMTSLPAGGMASGQDGSYTADQVPTSASLSAPSSSGPRASATPDLSMQDQQRLKQAVKLMVQSKGVTDGPAMSAQEVEERMRVQRNVIESFKEDEVLRKRIEPMQLIAYHINNFRVNHAYVLPASMRPTAVQRTIPHEHAIDGVPFPTIRDRMILLRGRYDLVEAYQGMLLEMVLRGDDPLDHRNWEFSEKWLHDFPILADEEVYAISNAWRAERGEPPLARVEQRV